MLRGLAFRGLQSGRARARLVAALFGALAMGAASVSVPAHAMGSGNPYEDFQVGVTYTVYQPTFTNGLPLRDSGGISCGGGSGGNTLEDSFSSTYNKNKQKNRLYQGRYFALLQGNPICADGALGANMGTRTINGVKWTINSGCLNDGGAPCSKAQSRNYKQYGGTLSATLPKVGQADPTNVRIGFGGMNLPIALKIAEGLSPAN